MIRELRGSLAITDLSPDKLQEFLDLAKGKGVRGGQVYDYIPRRHRHRAFLPAPPHP